MDDEAKELFNEVFRRMSKLHGAIQELKQQFSKYLTFLVTLNDRLAVEGPPNNQGIPDGKVCLVITPGTCGDNKFRAIKAIRNVTGARLTGALDLVEKIMSTGEATFGPYSSRRAENKAKSLRSAGFEVELTREDGNS